MYAFFLALSIGVISSLAILVIFVQLGVSHFGAYVFAGLGGITVFCFVWIERSLIAQIKEKDRIYTLEVKRRLEAQNRRYSRSLACFVRFDAGTLIIDQASPGFIKMLRLPMDTVLRGQRLEEVLGVNPLKLESVVDSIKMGDSSLKLPKVEILGDDGMVTQALISGQYWAEEHIVEAAFFVPPLKSSERIADLEAAQRDLDRFSRGMFRRETRILELKEEVNMICKEAKMPIRYQIDRFSDDSRLELSLSRKTDADADVSAKKGGLL
jgi:hypothetical protein